MSTNSRDTRTADDARLRAAVRVTVRDYHPTCYGRHNDGEHVASCAPVAEHVAVSVEGIPEGDARLKDAERQIDEGGHEWRHT